MHQCTCMIASSNLPKFTDGHVVTQAEHEKGHTGENCNIFYKVIGFFLFFRV